MNSATNAMMKVDNASFGPDHSRIPHNSIPSREPDTPMPSYHLDYGALPKTWQSIWICIALSSIDSQQFNNGNPRRHVLLKNKKK